MFKGTNKRGWIRIVEAFFAILVIAVVVLIVVQQDQNKRGDVSVRIHSSVTSIVRDLQLDNNIRSEIVKIPNSALSVNWNQFNASAPLTMEKIISETPSSLNCIGQICATNDSCLLEQNPSTTIYADSAIISSDIQTYNPRTLKVFCWQTNENVGSNTLAACGNGIVEAGETCDDGSIVPGDGCSSSCQVESGWTCQGQPSTCSQVVIPPGGSGITYLSSCTEITSPGNYVISNDLTGTAPNPCLSIHDTSNVQVDCQSHSLTVPGLRTGQTIVEINNTNNFSLKNCLLPVTSVPVGEIPESLHILSSSQGVISANTFSGKSLVNAGWLSDVQILNNVFNESAYQQFLSNNSRIENNWFDWNYTGVGFIISNDGSGTIIRNNFMDGHQVGNSQMAHTGFSTGIVIDGQSNSTITGNTMQNFFDCGIITLGLTQNTVMSNNTIKNALFCGIGGWYWNSMKNNTFSQNKVNNSGTLFTFFRRYALKPGESFVYFTDNIFTDNSFTNHNNYRGYATDIVMDRNDWGEVNSSAFIASNATFTNNDFGTGPGPYITPRSAIIDGGSNKCGPPSLGQTTSPLVCN